MSENESHSSEETSGTTSEDSWISWFCSLEGNEFYCEVDRDFIEDGFNLTNLPQKVDNYEKSLNEILDSEDEDDEDDDSENLTQSSINLFNLIHCRFIQSLQGMKVMKKRFEEGEFGTCPRVLCSKQHVLPFGPCNDLQLETVHLFCPRCENVYKSPSKKHKIVDGAAFGSYFPHFLLMQYPELVPVTTDIEHCAPKKPHHTQGSNGKDGRCGGGSGGDSGSGGGGGGEGGGEGHVGYRKGGGKERGGDNWVDAEDGKNELDNNLGSDNSNGKNRNNNHYQENENKN